MHSITYVAPPSYRGRFAPTPSGPLHLGSLTTALGSFLEARAAGGKWLLRIDDLDVPRVAAGSETRILRQLEAHGLHWDEALRRQSEHVDAYREQLDLLDARGLLYACDCSRARLKQESRPGPDDPVYSGRCRARVDISDARTRRLKVEPIERTLFDARLGNLHRKMAAHIGDFVLRRSDGQIGYQLASAVDEAAMGINHVVRGADLMGSSFRQAHLLNLMGLAPLQYLHLPLLTDSGGRKLSKQNRAEPVDESCAARNLHTALEVLGQSPPSELIAAPVAALMAWSIGNWCPAGIGPALQLKV